ncbi:MAG: hypothetical protein QOD60_2366 [Solirubrobacterales bacterium]|jgi:hypothetical protein|nr:hypothetical protein [Solirubrobacterales bacterium]
MSGNGASGEEMNTDVQRFMDSARVALTEPLDPRLEADLVRLVATEARTASAGTPTREIAAPRRRRYVLPVRIAVAAGSVVLASAGLAVAGVNLPDPVNSLFEKAGVDLPNQSSAKQQAEPATPAASQPGEGQNQDVKGNAAGNGKAKGKDKAHGHGKSHAPNGNANGQTGASNGQSESAPGHTKTQTSPPRAIGKAIGHEPKTAKPPPPRSQGISHRK